MDPDFEALAKQRAESLGLNFSAYVNQLIRKDLSAGGSLVLQEQSRTYGKSSRRKDRK
jgi:hypothetical protein